MRYRIGGWDWGRVLAAAAICLGVVSHPARADQLVFAGRTVMLDAPAGYCALDRGRAEEAARIETQEKLQAETNRLALYFADCQDLAKARESGAYVLSKYGMILLPLSRGKEAKATGMSREEYIAEVAKQFPTFDAASAIEAAKARLKDAGASVNGVRMLGVLAQDDAALYFGIGLDGLGAAAAGGQQRVLGVVGITVANAVPISVNLYRVDAGEEALPDLLAQDKAAVAALLAANSGVEAESARWVFMGIDFAGVLRAALIGGLAGAVIGAIGYLVKRLRRGGGA